MSQVRFISVGREFHIWEPFIEKADWPKEVLRREILTVTTCRSPGDPITTLSAKKTAQHIWCQVLQTLKNQFDRQTF